MKLTANTPDLISTFNEEEQAFLRSLADELLEMLEATERAMALKHGSQMFDIDEGLALWELLPAKVRTAIKRGGEQPGVACLECKLVGSHTRNCSIGGRFA